MSSSKNCYILGLVILTPSCERFVVDLLEQQREDLSLRSCSERDSATMVCEKCEFVFFFATLGFLKVLWVVSHLF